MNTVSVSQLKINPARILSLADEYPVAVEKHSTIQAYVIGKSLYDLLMRYVEDVTDRQEVRDADFAKKKKFSDLTHELGLPS